MLFICSMVFDMIIYDVFDAAMLIYFIYLSMIIYFDYADAASASLFILRHEPFSSFSSFFLSLMPLSFFHLLSSLSDADIVFIFAIFFDA